MEEYEPIKVLGEGSFGKVYLMKHSQTRDLVCTKVIKLKNIPPKEQEACRNEVELLRRMCHPNIVGYTNSFLYKNCLCIIMEFCDAGDLGDRVNEAKDMLLPESKVMTWFVQTALGLHYMHSHRVLHRDIKTQNVFILSSGRVVLGDLGISKLLGGTRDFASTCIGTPYYMSPEIFKNHPYNDKSDVWALGCLLYELLTLKHAFDAQSLNGLAGKIIKGKFPSVSSQYSKNLRTMVNDMLATNPKKRPDIEQILRKPFVQTRVKEFVGDLNADALHRSDKAMSNLSDQLIDLRMDDAVPTENLVVEEGDEDGDNGPNAPSPSESDAASKERRGSRSELKLQKHQLELEEEKRIAAEMALNRLRRKAAERRRRASMSRSPSPMGESGLGRIGSGRASPRTPGSPDDGGGSGGGDGECSPSRNRRPSLLQRLGSLATSPLQGRRKSLSTPASPSGTYESQQQQQQQQPASARGSSSGGIGNMSDVDRAMALAVAAAEQSERDSSSGGGGGDGGGGGGQEGVTKGPTGAAPRSLARPKEATDYVSNPPLRRRSKSGTNNRDSSSAAVDGDGGDNRSPRQSSASPRGSGSGSRASEAPQEERSSSPARRVTPDLPKLPLGSGASATPALRSGRSSGQEDEIRGRAERKSDPMFQEEDDNDFFHVLKEQTKAHDRGGEDKEVHDREEELRAKLKEAEQRCRDLQQGMDRVREEERGRRRSSVAAEAGTQDEPPPVPEAMEIGVNPTTAGSRKDGAGGNHRRGSHSGASSSIGDVDVASDFEDEPVPYCQSHLEELHDAPTPVGNLVDRVQFLRKKCSDGLGEKKFTRALMLLRSMQEGDCKVTVEGVEYDGNEDGDVEQILVKVIGKHKLHYWNLLDQLLLLSLSS